MSLLSWSLIAPGSFCGHFGARIAGASPLLLLACASWALALRYCLKPRPTPPLWLFASGGALAVAANMALAVSDLLG